MTCINFRALSEYITLVICGILLSFSVHAWTLPVGEFRFEQVAPGVYVMHGPLEEPNPENMGFMNNPGLIVTENGLVLVDPGSTLQVGEKILEEVAKISPKPVLAALLALLLTSCMSTSPPSRYQQHHDSAPAAGRSRWLHAPCLDRLSRTIDQ